MPRRTLSRRQTLALLAAAGTVPALGACGPNRSGSDSGGGEGAVSIYWWGGDLRLDLTRQALELFAKAHPDITVNPEYSEWTGYWDKLATKTSGGKAPDLIQMDEAYIDSYGTRGALLDLEQLSDVADLSQMDEKVLETGRLEDGTLVGSPLGVGIFSVGVNQDLLTEAGITAPDDSSWSWENLRELATQVSQWAKDAGKDVVGLDFFGQAAGELGAWARQHDQQVFPRADETLISADTIASYLDLGKSLIDAGATPGASEQVEDAAAGVEQGRFGTGRSALHLQFHTQIQTFQSASQAQMDLWRLPAMTPGQPHMVNKASMYWSIAAKSASPKNAGTLMSFLQTDPEAGKVLKIERGVTAFPKVQEALAPVLEGIQKTCLDFAQEMQAEVVRAPRVTPASGVSFGADFTRMTQDYYFGNGSLQDVAQQIRTALEGMQPES